MKKKSVCAVVSVPIEKLPYKYNEAEELVIMMKVKLSSMFQQAVADTTLAVMTNGEFSVSLFNFIVKLQVNGYYLFFL